MILNNHRSGSVGYEPEKSRHPAVTEERSGKVSEIKKPEKPKSYGADQCQRIEIVDGELQIVDC
ncbi:MAG: hypothetical protein ACH255_19910 [Candidatus Thiodiazotropha sp.]